MSKEDIKKKVLQYIDSNKENTIRFLESLVRIPSPSGAATIPQELILQKLEDMGFDIDIFTGNVEGIEKCADYCPLLEGEKIDERAFNLVGVKKGKKDSKSLMIFSHIDTEVHNNEKYPRNPYETQIVDGKLYGLGAADAKSGIATMILGTQAVLNMVPELDSTITIMSILGKKGGSAGTLAAIVKGYKADAGIYVHSAETGHGFQEIKNYSMGVVDFKVTVKGKEGVPVDELDNSEVNAIIKGGEVVKCLVKWNEERRKRLVFEEGEFKGEPSTKLNIDVAKGGTKIGKDPLMFEVNCKLYFAVGETIASVIDDLKSFMKEYFKDDEWLSKNPPIIELLYIRATPANISKESDIVQAVQNNITEVTGIDEFIYQYHGASDIRLPITYGGIPTVGIGPKGGGMYGAEWADWVDIEDYINGIKIIAMTIIDWCISDN